MENDTSPLNGCTKEEIEMLEKRKARHLSGRSKSYTREGAKEKLTEYLDQSKP
ncbi:hypothetical protein [Halocola ammonii]